MKIVSAGALTPLTAERLRRDGARRRAHGPSRDRAGLRPRRARGRALLRDAGRARDDAAPAQLRAGDLSLADVLDVGAQVARALHYSHQL